MSDTTHPLVAKYPHSAHQLNEAQKLIDHVDSCINAANNQLMILGSSNPNQDVQVDIGTHLAKAAQKHRELHAHFGRYDYDNKHRDAMLAARNHESYTEKQKAWQITREHIRRELIASETPEPAR